MKHNFQIDLEGTIRDLEFFPFPKQQNCDTFLCERMLQIHRVYYSIKKIHDKLIIVDIDEQQEMKSWLYRLIPQVTELQEIIFNMNYSSIHLNRMEFILDALLDYIPAVLKAHKEKVVLSLIAA